MKLSQHAKNITPSATLAVGNKAKIMKREGKPVISFGAGEPDFNSPPSAIQAAEEAIRKGETHYTPNPGIPELREAVCDYYKRHFNLTYKPEQTLVATGAKPLVYEALVSLVDPGDEVLLCAPAWVSYVEQIRLCDGVEALVDTADTGFVPTEEAFAKKITPKTVGMLLNTPSNPTGAVYSEATLKTIADLARKHNLWIIFDEIYERLVYGDAKHLNILQVAPDIADRVVIINGVSKAFAMTGWRIGYALGPTDVIKAMSEVQGHLTSNAASISQYAALGALRGAEADVETMRQAFEKRCAAMDTLLAKVPGVRFAKPQGAFYAFVDVSQTKLPDDVAFCTRLLEEKYVAAVPGRAFFAPGYVRFSYANSLAEIEEGMKRLKEFVESL